MLPQGTNTQNSNKSVDREFHFMRLLVPAVKKFSVRFLQHMPCFWNVLLLHEGYISLSLFHVQARCSA
jgi:hypothetical protein